MRAFFVLVFAAQFVYAQSLPVTVQMHHLRNGATREWSTFPVAADTELKVNFSLEDATSWQTIIIRQKDVRQDWKIAINGRNIGQLVNDEKDLTIYFNIPSNVLVDGANTLRVSTSSTVTDDIRIGDISINKKPVSSLTATAQLNVVVVEGQTQVPAKITILNDRRSMVLLSPGSNTEHVAIRPGCVYTLTGEAGFGLPSGIYTIFATRGFEYSVDSAKIELKEGDSKSLRLSISREVDTRGWISSDTHVHTSTHSGHGDATDRERIITLAAEGIELPVITDHNKHVDLLPVAESLGARQWMTLVNGNEVTTPVGHFNVFPVDPGKKPVDHRVDNWNTLHDRLNEYGNVVVVLNHANDIHNGFRPFDSSIHIAVAGHNNRNWTVPANAMEILNSGSQQSDITELYSDWFGMLNGGQFLTPVGSSDSHDVTRFIVGQGRTYIKGDDSKPSALDINAAVKNMLEGRVLVSSGLLTTIKVDQQFGPGDIVKAKKGKVNVDVGVYGPSWTKADRVLLFVNGVLKEEKRIDGTKVEKWKGTWSIDVPKHDIFISAVALGPASKMPFWPMERPYQSTSENYIPHVIGVSGAVWLDGDENGNRNSANDYARDILKASKGVDAMIESLKKYDKAVALQLAVMMSVKGYDDEVVKAVDHAPAYIKEAFEEINKSIKR